MKTRRNRFPKKSPSIPKQFTVYLPDDLNRWLRDRAEREGRTLTVETTRAVRAYKSMLETSVHA